MNKINLDSIPRDKALGERLSTLDLEALKDLTAQAEARLSGLVASLEGAVARSWKILSWLLATIASLVAILASQARGGGSNLIIALTVYALIAAAVIAAHLTISNIVNVHWYVPGCDPSDLYPAELHELAARLSEKPRHRSILVWNLVDIQQRIDFNRLTLAKLVRGYRRTLYAILTAVAGAVILLAILTI